MTSVIYLFGWLYLVVSFIFTFTAFLIEKKAISKNPPLQWWFQSGVVLICFPITFLFLLYYAAKEDAKK